MLFASLPMGYLIMFVITVFLFNSIKESLVTWFTAPLSIIGVSIVLLDQINLELAEGRDPYDAVVHRAISRVCPVSMAAVTTILGMIPLVFDAFFGSMAITIMAGLCFATVLTLIVLPVMFAIMFKVKNPKVS